MVNFSLPKSMIKVKYCRKLGHGLGHRFTTVCPLNTVPSTVFDEN